MSPRWGSTLRLTDWPSVSIWLWLWRLSHSSFGVPSEQLLESVVEGDWEEWQERDKLCKDDFSQSKPRLYITHPYTWQSIIFQHQLLLNFSSYSTYWPHCEEPMAIIWKYVFHRADFSYTLLFIPTLSTLNILVTNVLWHICRKPESQSKQNRHQLLCNDTFPRKPSHVRAGYSYKRVNTMTEELCGAVISIHSVATATLSCNKAIATIFFVGSTPRLHKQNQLSLQVSRQSENWT
jgi:hypothetical protein